MNAWYHKNRDDLLEDAFNTSDAEVSALVKDSINNLLVNIDANVVSITLSDILGGKQHLICLMLMH